MENYLYLNAGIIQQSDDRSLLTMDAIRQWGVEVGNSVIKAKTAAKEVEAEKVETDEYQTYRDIFSAHPTFKSSLFFM